MRITQLEIFRIRVPFKRNYVHAEADRKESENIVVRIRSGNAICGLGETIPREYLTGETPLSVVDSLLGTYAPLILGTEFDDFDQIVEFLSAVATTAHESSTTAAFCAIDLAMLDIAGKRFSRPISDAIGENKKRSVHYTGPISGEGRWSTVKSALKLKLARFSQIKVKVGVGDDEARLALVRKIMGNKVDIRIDANCAWRPDEAVERIARLKPFGISSVEQPVEGRDFKGMQFVRERCGLPIMADESACITGDASRLAEMGACDILNVRLAKCGGITGSLKMMEIARANSMKCQLGCLVGETSILGAAGRHFAIAASGLIHVEGSYNRHLLGADVAFPRTGFGLNGFAVAMEGHGLGVHLDETALAECTIEHKSIEE